MNFYDWMIYRGLSKSSALKYDGALQGSLSQWAVEGGLIEGPLIALTSHASLARLLPQIRALPIYEVRNGRGHSMYSATLTNFGKYLESNGADDGEDDLAEIITDPFTTTTDKLALIKARIRQGTFREKLLRHWNSCAVTGINDTSLLVASHIKPWSKSTNIERLSQWNGLLLSPNLDKAFDTGFITFKPDGAIQLSPLFTDASLLGISLDMKVKLMPEHQPYMEHHRTVEFKRE